jgi:hypothetical protein
MLSISSCYRGYSSFLEMKLKDLDKIEFKKMPTVVVYRKTKGSKSHYMLVTTQSVDTVNSAQAKKPLIAHKYEIIDLGMGQTFIDIWAKKYKINDFDFVE